MQKKALTCLISCGLLALAAGCGGGGGEKQAASTPPSHGQAPATQAAATPPAGGEAGMAAQPAAGGGTGVVKGTVRLEGAPPAGAKLKMDADPYCKTQHAASAPTAETVATNPDGTLRNVFVYVKSGLEGKQFTAPTEPAIIDQLGCTYHPHVLGIMVGQPLKILNSDATLHNIHSLAKNSRQFNLGMPIEGMELTQKFTAEEVMVFIKCDVHPWMGAYVGVLGHPFHSVTADGGAFELKDLPEGTYTIEAWHEKYGTQTQQVTVKAGAPAEVSFTFKAAAA
jgi:plastocyanin